MNPELMPVFSRRSIRKYKPDTIPEEMIKDLLEAAMAAPSAVGRDPWEFIVVQNQETLSKVTEALPNGKMLAEAPLGIIVCGDLNRTHDGHISFLLQDCSAAIENILITASMLGLGACWLGIHPREERVTHIRELFSLPEHIIPVSAIAIGFPDEEKEARTR
ncbi:MAG: nitroreductase family protein, partial [Verrucomicrobiota bacterium]